MAFPLLAAYEAITRLVNFPVPPLEPSATSFDFGAEYPIHVANKQPMRVYEVRASLNIKSESLVLTAGVHGANFSQWEGMREFLETVSRRVKIFLDDQRYLGRLIALSTSTEKEYLAPGYQVYLGVRGANEEHILEAIPCAFHTLLHTLYLVHPVFRFIAATGKEPDTEEIMRLLYIEYGSYEITRISPDIKEEKKKAELKRVFLPSGMGGTELMPQ